MGFGSGAVDWLGSKVFGRKSRARRCVCVCVARIMERLFSRWGEGQCSRVVLVEKIADGCSMHDKLYSSFDVSSSSLSPSSVVAFIAVPTSSHVADLVCWQDTSFYASNLTE